MVFSVASLLKWHYLSNASFSTKAFFSFSWWCLNHLQPFFRKNMKIVHHFILEEFYKCMCIFVLGVWIQLIAVVEGLWSAFLFGIIVCILNWLCELILHYLNWLCSIKHLVWCKCFLCNNVCSLFFWHEALFSWPCT